MGKFDYTDGEREINKVLKMNQDLSTSMLNDENVHNSRSSADDAIASSQELLKRLGKGKEVQKITEEVKKHSEERRREPIKVKLQEWDELITEAEEMGYGEIELEDILTEAEIQACIDELETIESEFSKKTSIINKTDLAFLAVATALQVAKSLIFPYVAEKAGYGEKIDKSKRLAHNDKSIEQAHRKANDDFKEKHLEKHGTGYWINILYQTPPYDITRGSAAMGKNMGGAYHRMCTLGHDPILGWVFGTLNILTDTVTFNDFTTNRVIRKPAMQITPQTVMFPMLIAEGYECVKADYLNLPAAIFAEAQHLKSDEFTKLGLPVPILEAVNEQFASDLYKNGYDALCMGRDIKIIGTSFVVSKLIDIIIGLVHGLFRDANEDKKLYEARTRKILLISNSIASTSSIIATAITENPKALDIGGLLNTVMHLFTDIRFITKLKKEYIEGQISGQLQAKLAEIDNMIEII